MLDQFPVHPTLPAADLERARAWYEAKVGLMPVRQDDAGLWYEFAGRVVLIYQSGFAGSAQNTAAEWVVRDIESVMDAMRGRGVVFEDYDFPGLKTENGLANLGPWKAAWFKDSEGNTLSITESEAG